MVYSAGVRMTVILNVQSISKSFGVDSLFNGISFSVQEGDKIGLIGPNGCGKSTLLKILLGTEVPDTGKVIRNRQFHLVYLPQEDLFNSSLTVGDVFQQYPSYQIAELTGQPLDAWNLHQSIETLSGGWRKRLAIVTALLQKPDLMLMDEPTNHLDLEGILWLENILQNANFSYVLISHDRFFLENTVNGVMELHRGYSQGFFKSAGNYSEFLEKRQEIFAQQLQQQDVMANKMRREQEWLQRGPKARTTKAQYRIDHAETLRENLRKLAVSNAQHKKAEISFAETGRKTKVLVEAQQLSKKQGDKLLFENLNLTLTPGDCIGLMGKNGSGKSTLLNLLNKNLKPDAGTIRWYEHLRIVSFDQRRVQLNKNQTLWKALAPDGDSVLYKGQSIHVAAWAKRFLFPPDQLHQSVSRLSGGEQARVLIANLMLKPADLLLLDEPTNDLDIPTLEVLENSLAEFEGAIVLITHDRYLLEKLSTRLLYLNGEGKAEFFADYAQWFENQAMNKKIVEIAEADHNKKKITYEQQKELNRLPDKIQKAEAELETLQNQLTDASIVNDQKKLIVLCQQIEAAKNKVEQLYKRWEELGC